jgi:hypothetical protein
MGMYSVKPETAPHASVKNQAAELIDDVKSEVKHEVNRIHTVREPVDSSQSDHVVRRHVAGLSITFFFVIALFLLTVIAGVVIYTHGHH